MTIAGRIREKRLRPEIECVEEFYAQKFSESEIEQWQLERVNALWARYIREIPYYSDLTSARKAPERFRSLEEFATTVPVPSRSLVQDDWQRMHFTDKPHDSLSVTGGSTGKPVRIPSRHEDLRHTEPNRWWARGWYGILPSDKLLLFWGHTHLYGTGLRGVFKAQRRKLKDWLLGYSRESAFCMTIEKAREALQAIESVRPDYIIGYTTIIEMIMRANSSEDHKPIHHAKAVIATTEPLSFEGVKPELEAFYGCPFAMEYGSSECDLIGHTHPSGGYRTFWGTYLLERGEEAEGGACKAYVTSLYPRHFPLVRYDLSDEITNAKPAGLSIGGFSGVVSTRKDLLALPDGSFIHTGALEVALRSLPDIVSLQMIQGDDVSVEVVSTGHVSPEAVAQVRHRLSIVHPLLAQIDIRQVDHLRQTIAGKTPLVWKL